MKLRDHWLSAALVACACLAALDDAMALLAGDHRHAAALRCALGVSVAVLSVMHVRKSSRIIRFFKTKVLHHMDTTEQNLQAKLSEKRLQLRLLENQINPHFLYNTLDCIRSQALMYKQPEIADIIERLSRYFRYSISQNGHIVSIRQELRNVKDYFYIQRYRFGERIDMRIDIENESLLDYIIPKTVLQPLVENAIIHGLEPMPENGSIILSVQETESCIYISISDTGVGMSLSRLQEVNDSLRYAQTRSLQGKTGSKASIGLTNVNERIHICFGNDYGLHFRSVQNAGTDVQLIIPKVSDAQWLSFNDRLNGRIDIG